MNVKYFEKCLCIRPRLRMHMCVRKLEIEGTQSAIFLIETALRRLFCVPSIVYLNDHQMSIIKHFSVNSIKSEFGNTERVEF